jgi:tetratricopeptide (TPR) repeat protein
MNGQAAKQIIEDGIAWAKELKEVWHLGWLYNQAGIIASEKSDHHAAIEHYRKAQSCFLEGDDPTARVSMEHNIGEEYLEMGMFHEAVPYLENAVVHYREHGQTDLLTLARINLGNAYAALNRYEVARICFKQLWRRSIFRNLTSFTWLHDLMRIVALKMLKGVLNRTHPISGGSSEKQS